jgi:hypothetical protein
MRRQVVRPSPLPGAPDALPRRNGSKIVSASAGSTPTPWSRTPTRHSPSRARRDLDVRLGFAAELQGVGDQVLQHERHAVLACVHNGLHGHVHRDPRSAILDRRGKVVEHAANDWLERDEPRARRHLPGTRVAEQRLDQGVHPADAAHDLLEKRDRLGWQLLAVAAVDEVREPADGAQRLGEIVRRQRREPLQVGVGAQQVLLERAAFRQVARDLAEADVLATAVIDRRDDDVGPEARAVLAHAPALLLEPPHRDRHLELVCRVIARDGVGRVEGAEVAADDLVGAVALDPLRATVPRRDVTARIEHEDGVVAHLLDQQDEAVGALIVGCHTGSIGHPRSARSVRSSCEHAFVMKTQERDEARSLPGRQRMAGITDLLVPPAGVEPESPRP